MSDHTPMNAAAIAIIGMACRFPDAPSPEAFWQNLAAGHEAIVRFSDPELLAAGVDPALLRDPNYVKAGTRLADYDCFDAPLFGFTPREAELLDPQQRLLLETAWTALEDAGYCGATYRGAIGVYAGSGTSLYLLNHLYPNHDLLQSAGAYQVFLSNSADFLATRISYKLNLTGPSVTVQTACSTSLVAIHVACQSLLAGECDMAIAGGVTLQFPQPQGYLYQAGMIFAPDGHCRAFAADAQGTVGSSGVGVVLLKPWAAAVADGDLIHAVIRGSAINNDGSAKVSFMAPSIDGQARVIREAQAVAEVAPETITYVEAHGTGTVLGDPIEIAALTQAFQTHQHGYCALGSVKTNLGHTDTAAGVAGLIKTVLALKHGMIPPSLHAAQPNPALALATSPFYVNTTLAPWQSKGTPRRAGVSSFGAGGTNAHVVLEEAAPRAPSGPARPWQLLLLSARSDVALEHVTSQLADHLTDQADCNLADVAYTLATGRQRHTYRRMLVAQGQPEASSSLHNAATDGRILTGYAEATQRPVVFMFPGQGVPLVNMGRELYAVEPVFRTHVDQCAELLMQISGFDLRTLLYPAEGCLAEATERLNQFSVAQPALFVISYALAQQWLAWGVKPHAMIGHSIGEYVAATLAGVLSLTDALRLVAVRGRLMQSLPEGAMLTVSLPPAQLTPPDGLAIAAINAPAMCVISGPTDAIAAFQHQLTEQGVSCQRLHISRAGHSSMLEPILALFAAQFVALQLQPPQIPYISNLTGTWITAQEATDPTYWVRHLRQPVQFASGIAELLKEPDLIMLEVGPGRTLSTLARQQPGLTEQVVIPSLPQTHATQADGTALQTALGQIWLAGGVINWAGFYAHERRQRLALPTYPFERQRYWIDPPALVQAHSTQSSTIKKQPMRDWFYAPSWQRVATPHAIVPPPQVGSCWLLFVDESGLCDQLATRLNTAGHAVITVRAGVAFMRQGDSAYILDPQQPEQYAALITELVRRDLAPQHVVHLWRVTAAISQPTTVLTASDLTTGFYSLIFLARALGAVTNPVHLTVISNQLHCVTGAETLIPEQATLLGPVKVIPQEYPHIRCYSIDLEVGAEVTAPARVVDQVLAELALHAADVGSTGQKHAAAPIVAYRGTYRWEPTFRPLRLDNCDQGALGQQNRIREGGVYLITGGLGGIGLLLAEYLATFHAKLVLVSRSPFPPRAAWAEWLATHAEDDALSANIGRLQAIAQAGAEVLVLAADVADEPQMRAVIAQAERSFGPLHGVIHTAGITHGSHRFIQALSPADCEPQFRAKVYGPLVLQHLLKDKSLDFCMLFSSLSSILGGIGFAAYAAANAFLDAFVTAQNQTNATQWVSVNWDGWRLQPVNLQTTSALGRSTIELALTPTEGIAVFRSILNDLQAQPLAQIVVSTGDIATRIGRWVNPEAPPRTPEATPARVPATRASQRPYVAPRNQIEQNLVAIWQELLGIGAIGIMDNFWELGGHSLLATQVLARIRTTFQITLSMQSIFEEPTVAGLSSYLALTQRIAVGAPVPASLGADELEEGVL